MISSYLPTVSSEIAPSGKLRVALIGANPVLVTIRAGGAIGGVSADLGELIAESLGLAFEPRVYPNADSYARSFGSGQWDIAIGPRTPIAEAHSDFTRDFMLVDNIYVAAPGSDFADASEVDWPGVRIAVVLNGAPDQFLSGALNSASLVRIAGSSEAIIEALRSGEADVYGSNAENVYEVARGLAGAKIVPGSFRTVRMAVAYPKGLSAAAQNAIAGIVSEARTTALVRRAIELGGLKAVQAIP